MVSALLPTLLPSSPLLPTRREPGLLQEEVGTATSLGTGLREAQVAGAGPGQLGGPGDGPWLGTSSDRRGHCEWAGGQWAGGQWAGGGVALLPREVLPGGEVAKRGACPRSPGQQHSWSSWSSWSWSSWSSWILGGESCRPPPFAEGEPRLGVRPTRPDALWGSGGASGSRRELCWMRGCKGLIRRAISEL